MRHQFKWSILVLLVSALSAKCGGGLGVGGGTLSGGSSSSSITTSNILAAGGVTTNMVNGSVILRRPDGTYSNFLAAANTDAARGNAFTNANNTAASGDLIDVYHNLKFPTGYSLFVKNDVTYRFAAVDVQFNAGGISDNSGAVSAVIIGDANFSFSNNVSTASIDFSGSKTNFIECQSIFGDANNDSSAAVWAHGSVILRVYAKKYIRSYSYDGLIADDTAKLYFKTPELIGADNSIEQNNTSFVEGSADNVLSTNGFQLDTATFHHLILGTIFASSEDATTGYKTSPSITTGSYTYVRTSQGVPYVGNLDSIINNLYFGGITKGANDGAGITNISGINVIFSLATSNIVIGTTYSNSYGNNLLISGLGIVSVEAAVAGQAAIMLGIEGVKTNVFWSQLTAIGLVTTGTATNTIPSFIIPSGARWKFTDVSAGVGNSAATFGGIPQFLLY